jgi:magnesium transporter
MVKSIANKSTFTDNFIHINKSVKTKVKILDYTKKSVKNINATDIKESVPFKNKASVTWINLIGTPSSEVLKKVEKSFGIHHLTLDDITSPNKRPKIEYHDEYVFLTLKTISYDEIKQTIKTEPISLILGPKFVLSFQKNASNVFDSVREYIETPTSIMRKKGSDYLAYALIDAIVDNYFKVLEKIEDLIEATEKELMGNPNQKTANKIHKLESEMLFLRKAVWPLREVLSNIQREEIKLIKPETAIYFRQVYGHIMQAIDTIETFREMVSGMLDIYLSSVNNRMNEVMNVLTIIATIFIPLTFITGLYGMNFKFMPELYMKWTYPAILGLMGVIALGMVIYFKKKKWF